MYVTILIVKWHLEKKYEKRHFHIIRKKVKEDL